MYRNEIDYLPQGFPNGAETVWEDDGQGANRFSLVRVPVSEGVSVVYRKPSLGLVVRVEPTEEDDFWLVEGLIDPDTMANLGMPVTRERRAERPPVVTQKDVDAMATLGSVHRTESGLLDVSLQVLPDHVSNFFGKVWTPTARRGGASGVPNIDLGIDKSHRVLPRKEPRRRVAQTASVWVAGPKAK